MQSRKMQFLQAFSTRAAFRDRFIGHIMLYIGKQKTIPPGERMILIGKGDAQYVYFAVIGAYAHLDLD